MLHCNAIVQRNIRAGHGVAMPARAIHWTQGPGSRAYQQPSGQTPRGRGGAASTMRWRSRTQRWRGL